MRSPIAWLLASLAVFTSAPLHAQVEAEADAAVGGATSLEGTADRDSPLDHWWLGAYYRHLEVPVYMTDPFFSRAPSVTNDGFGLVATYRTGNGLNVVMGLGYMPYEFSGTFLADNSDIEDTELVRSDLAFWHLTGSLLWDIEFHHTVALEIGFGIDLGVLTGEIRRNEAYLDPATGAFRDCVGPLNPNVTRPGGTSLFCELPENGSGLQGSDDVADEGEHYNQIEDRVPPVMLFPMIPQVTLRITPFKHLALKGEFGFGVVQFWVGVSLHGSFGMFESGPQEVVVEPEAPVASGPAPSATGRVLGKAVEAESDLPISGATVRVKGRAISPLATETDGRFVVDRLDPGQVHFEVEHPDYEPGKCQVEISKKGGDVAVQCHLTPRARVGAISGQIQDEKGNPVASKSIELAGARSQQLSSDERGLFAAVDLPAGSYRLKVEAEGYLVQLVEVEVEPNQTAMPQIILIKKPKRSLVELRKEEIVIKEQVQFKSGSAEILADSENLLRQVADVILSHEQIQLIEVQGHTDSKGGHEMNMKLSQARAESVRDWLVKKGVAADRLEGKGYGPDHPIRPNNTAANRAKNRRVQFIIRRQATTVEAAEE